MKAIWKDQVVAEAERDDLIYIEGHWYFPPVAVLTKMLRASDTPYTCPWKGKCQYYDVGEGNDWSHDSAFSYPDPKPSAIDTVHKDFSGYIAFWRDITIQEA